MVSKFTNYGFNSYAVINGKAVAGSASGLFLLEGDTDNGTPIIATVTTPALNFGTYLPKKLRGFRIGGRFDGDVTITADNGTSQWPVTLSMLNDMKAGYKTGYFTHPTRGEYLTFTVTNPGGEAFMLDEVSLYMMILERR